jgi:hypothetical protein
MLTRLLKVFLTIALTASLAGGSVATFSALLWGDSSTTHALLPSKMRANTKIPSYSRKRGHFRWPRFTTRTSSFSGTPASAAQQALSTYCVHFIDPAIKQRSWKALALAP